MLTGYLKCKDMGKIMLPYINFELSKKEMAKAALHLRNCPICMQKYTNLQKRKKELKEKMPEILKKIRMQDEISSYIDNEASEDLIFIIEGMLLCDENYKKELISNEALRRIMISSKEEVKNQIKLKVSTKIIANIRNKKYAKARFLKKLTQPFQPLLRVFAKYV